MQMQTQTGTRTRTGIRTRIEFGIRIGARVGVQIEVSSQFAHITRLAHAFRGCISGPNGGFAPFSYCTGAPVAAATDAAAKAEQLGKPPMSLSLLSGPAFGQVSQCDPQNAACSSYQIVVDRISDILEHSKSLIRVLTQQQTKLN